jgi:hypothetical protein
MTGSLWVVSYIALWVAVIVLSLAVLALLRQVGVLHARLRPIGVHPAGEGLEPGAAAPAVPDHEYAEHDLTLVAFTSPDCTICADLLPGLRAMDGQYDDLSVRIVEYAPETTATFLAFNVSSTPYLTAVDARGLVKGRGVANSVEQAEILVAAARQDTGSLGAL